MSHKVELVGNCSETHRIVMKLNAAVLAAALIINLCIQTHLLPDSELVK